VTHRRSGERLFDEPSRLKGNPQRRSGAQLGLAIGEAPAETASGAHANRPTLEQVLDQLRPGDTLVVWKLDRFGRSLRHLVDTVTGLADRGVGFCSLQEAIDTTTPGASSCSMSSLPWPSSNAT
jgi:DNA invertase Pin-like site-specific DNA recombinase